MSALGTKRIARPSAAIAKAATTPRQNRAPSPSGTRRAREGKTGASSSVAGSGGASLGGEVVGATARTRKKAKWRNGNRKSPHQKGLTPMSRSLRAESESPAARNGSAT